MARRIDQIKEQEKEAAEEREKNPTAKPAVITQLQSSKSNVKNGESPSGKTRQMSAKVPPRLYEMFTAINRHEGISNNSAINLMMSNYVREKKFLLDEK